MFFRHFQNRQEIFVRFYFFCSLFYLRQQRVIRIHRLSQQRRIFQHIASNPRVKQSRLFPIDQANHTAPRRYQQTILKNFSAKLFRNERVFTSCPQTKKQQISIHPHTDEPLLRQNFFNYFSHNFCPHLSPSLSYPSSLPYCDLSRPRHSTPL